MMTASLNKGVSAFLIVSLWLAGCGEWAYRSMDDSSRDAWQKPKEVIQKLAIKPGSRVADLGSGGGYFTWHLAQAVGLQGKVYAVDIDETALGLVERGIRSRGITNVVPIRAEPSDAKLPEPVDLVFSCDTYHHMQDRVAYFKSLVRYLKPDGQVAILDFHPHGFFSGLLGHGTAKEEVRREMESAGYRLVDDYDFIESQHFQIFARKDSTTATGFHLFIRASAPSTGLGSIEVRPISEFTQQWAAGNKTYFSLNIRMSI